MKLFVGAKALVARPDEKVLIVRESAAYEEGTNTGFWDVVGGRIESEEPLFDGLRREILEESGLEVVVGEVVYVAEGFPVIKGEKVHVIRVYFCCRCEASSVCLSTDHDKYEWIDPADSGLYKMPNDVTEAFEKYLTLT
jgi:8-oxo-dGTP diphosphatase